MCWQIQKIDEEGAKALSLAADEFWKSVSKRDVFATGKALVKSFEAQISMFPNMVTAEIVNQLNYYKQDDFGWKISGAGGGGYLILLSEKPVENAIQIRIRRE